MPSSAALARYFIAFMSVSINQEAINLPPYASRDISLNQEVTGTPLYGNRDTSLDQEAMHPILYASRDANLNQEATNTPHCDRTSTTPPYRTSDTPPTHQDGNHIAQNSGVYMCVDGGFTGYCRYFSNPFGQCTNLDDDLAHKVSAAGPDKGSWCTLYAGRGCTGEEYQLHWPGESHLGDRGYGDKAVSYNCAAE